MNKNNILVKYVKNTAIAGLVFAPIVMYSYFTGGRALNEDDVIAFFMFGWIMGSFFKAIFTATVSTTKDAIETIDELKNGPRGE